MEVRRARIPEAPAIAELVNHYAQQGLMLPKNVLEVYEHIREFMVAVEEGEMLGCGVLRIMWHDLAEVRSLAVSSEAKGRGLGKQLVKALVAEARDLGLARVFALTYQVDFFSRLGFEVVSKEIFPQKVWLDCKGCLKRDCCDEIAMILVLDPERAKAGEAESLQHVFARRRLQSMVKS